MPMDWIKKSLSWGFRAFVLNSLRPKIYKLEMRFGLILILVGVVLLLQNTGVFQPEVWKIIWPLVIIAVGLMFVFHPRRRSERRGNWFSGEGRHRSKEKE